jgi:hypothetical protein
MDIFNKALRFYSEDNSLKVLDELIRTHDEISWIFPQLKWYMYQYMSYIIDHADTAWNIDAIWPFNEAFIVSQNLEQLPEALKNFTVFRIFWKRVNFYNIQSNYLRETSETNDFNETRNYKLIFDDVMKWLVMSNSSELKNFLWDLSEIYATDIDTLDSIQLEIIWILYWMRTWVFLTSTYELQNVFINSDWIKDWITKELLWWKQVPEVVNAMNELSTQKIKESIDFVNNWIIYTVRPRSVRWNHYEYFKNNLSNWIRATKLHGLESIKKVVDWDMSPLWINTYAIDGKLYDNLLEEITYWDGILVLSDVSREWIEATKYGWKLPYANKTEAFEYSGNPAMKQFIFKGVLPATQIDAFIVQERFIEKYWKQWVEDMKKAIVENWFYLPIYDLNWELLFDYEEYQKLESDVEK